jgi:choice-of-anchor A domain-containing protein
MRFRFALAFALVACANLPASVQAGPLDVPSQYGAFLLGSGSSSFYGGGGNTGIASNGSLSVGGISFGPSVSFYVPGTVNLGSATHGGGTISGTLYTNSTPVYPFPNFPSYVGVTHISPTSASPTQINFAQQSASLTAYSKTLAGMTANGTVNLNTSIGQLFLTGTNPVLNVFNLTSNQLLSHVTPNISVPAGSTVLINVSGASITWTDFAENLTGATADKILYNFSDATSLTIGGAGYEGTILAPFANVNQAAAVGNDAEGFTIFGTLIAQSLNTTGRGAGLQGVPFDGVIPTPEPSTLLVFGALGMGTFIVRRRTLPTA